MPTATQQDDDLLIIADDTAADESADAIEFSFDTEESHPISSDIQVEKTNEAPQTVQSEQVENSTMESAVMKTEKSETTVPSEDFSFNLM